jgi:alpha-tubulin suppressor-like RCC1 family protein|tara:strand:- start:2667 stop:3830 length:1164 start_codon:yes stop_codon:yes gene_type:complete
MSIRKNTWNLNNKYDLTKSGWDTYTDTRAPLEVYSFGYNTVGELGLNDRTDRSSPTQIPGTEWINVSGSYNTMYGIKSDGTMWTWGADVSGQQGLNTQGAASAKSSPTQIPGTEWHTFKGGQTCCLATKTDGTLWAWGNGDKGQTALNSEVPRSSPTQIPGTEWNLTQFSTNRTQSVALKTDGTMWTWGRNDPYGTLGVNDKVSRSSPVQVPGTDWNSVSTNYFRMYGTKSDGTIWSWGVGTYGNLAHNNITQYSSPRQIPGTQWTSVPVSQSYTNWAFKTGGELYNMGGYGSNGTLARNDRVAYSSPAQIPGTQWASLSASYYVQTAIKTDGTAWVWGQNWHGSLGLNQTSNYKKSSPTQVPGTNWKKSGVGGYTKSVTFLLSEPE